MKQSVSFHKKHSVTLFEDPRADRISNYCRNLEGKDLECIRFERGFARKEKKV